MIRPTMVDEQRAHHEQDVQLEFTEEDDDQGDKRQNLQNQREVEPDTNSERGRLGGHGEAGCTR
jgi:hypothetical protein